MQRLGGVLRSPTLSSSTYRGQKLCQVGHRHPRDVSQKGFSTSMISGGLQPSKKLLSTKGKWSASSSRLGPSYYSFGWRNVSTSVKEDPSYSLPELGNRSQNANLLRLITAYRRYGHAIADLDPLELQKRIAPPELELSRYGLEDVPQDQEFATPGLINMVGKEKATLGEILDHLKKSYCTKIGAEFAYVQRVFERRWFSDALESFPVQQVSNNRKLAMWKLMAEAEAFDHFMQTKFPFVKRYALEGLESMIAALDVIFASSVKKGVDHIVIGMPHRGRLNLLAGLLRYPPKNIFWKVKGNSEFPEGVSGIGDVLSHIGTSVDVEYDGKPLHISLIQNPSHLEAVDSVALGKVRALQTSLGESSQHRVMCLMIHGDASFYGQGNVAETLGISKLPEFTTGGTVHLIANNQLGFTTPPIHGRSSMYSADLIKIIDGPSFHVNADSPEDVVKVCQAAANYRAEFKSDIIIDLIGYRRHGHNELDEPAFTQPLMYKVIRSKPSVVKTYGEKLEKEGLISKEEMEKFIKNCHEKLAQELIEAGPVSKTSQHLEGKWSKFVQPKDITVKVDTGFKEDLLKKIAIKSAEVPQAMEIHPRLEKFFCKPRLEGVKKNSIDWATAEAMAFGSLLSEGYHVRLCGQDSGRGTFSQRHAELIDQQTEQRFIPLNNIGAKGKMQIVNSPLSEFAVLGFEYGFSIQEPTTLPIWEAQFGDFHNGAQIIIDNFISSGESKWLKQSGLVMLLPHGYDGAGPEHSSARMERFLQLVDADSVSIDSPSNKNPNMRVVNVTTPANYFHVLRRQMKTNYRKPLIVMAPKTLLRHAKAVSTIEEMAPGTSFQPVIGDSDVDPSKVNRVILCSGKIFLDLVQEREKKKMDQTTAIIRVEELSPFPLAEVQAEVSKYTKAKETFWVQDESQNAGGWLYVEPRLKTFIPQIQYIGRPPCPASAVGIGAVHKKETEDLLNAAFPSSK